MNAQERSKRFLIPLSGLTLAMAGYVAGQFSAFSPKTAVAGGMASQSPVAAISGAPNATQPSSASLPFSAAAVSNLFVRVADQSMPSVVNIFTTKDVRPRGSSRGPRDLHDFWQRFFDGEPLEDLDGQSLGQALPRGSRPQPRRLAPSSLGTGFVIEASEDEGLIVTNHHVIDGADEVHVKFTESDAERQSPAQVIGTDPELDIALLRVKLKDRKIVPIALGDSEKLKVGEWVAAIGNPFGHGHSVSHGIVSAKERALPGGFGKYLQVDAPINPGNSGGPLVNMNGEVIGINNAIDARGPGIGFAIPINAVKAALSQLKSNGHVERGYIGVAIAPRTSDGAPLVADVVPGESAARAGIRPNDVIRSIDGREITNSDELIAIITSKNVGQTLKAQIERDGRLLDIAVRVGRRPDPRQARNG